MEGRPERSLLRPEVGVAALVALVVVATFPDGYAPRWSARAAIYLVAAPVGLVALARLARVGDRTARVGLVFIGATVVSAALAPSPARSLLPVQYRHESVVFFIAGLGTWAMARQLDGAGKLLVQRAFVGAVLASISVAVVQLLADVSTGPLALVGGRPEGLSLNPVYLGSLSAGCAAWCAASLWGASTSRWWALALGVSSLGVWVAGSRVAVLALVCVVGASIVQARTRAVPTIVVPVVAGLLAGDLVRRIPDEARDLAGRLGGGAVASGLGVRREVWGFDLQAFLERPVFGHGPGRHANAIESHYSADFVARTDPDEFLNAWTDAHNIGFELLVTVGAVGLLLAIAFGVLNLRAARGPAAWAAGAAALSWVLQPIGMVTLIPVAALLGSAVGATDGDDPPPWMPMATGWRVGLASAAVLAGSWFVIGEALLSRADSERTLAAAERAAAVWWHDPMAAHDAAVFGVREGLADPDDGRRTLELAVSATDREPDLAYWWIRRGDFEVIFGRPEDARRSYGRAMDLQPWSRAAALGLLNVLDPETDADRVEELTRRLAEVDGEEPTR